jgi:hypothetical protein
MIEEDREEFFGRYWAAKRAVAAYGLSEDFEDEPSVTTAPNSSAAWAANAPIENPSDVFARAVSEGHPRFIRVFTGTGKSYVFGRHTSGFLKPFGTLPATLVTSAVAVTLSTSGHGGSMATQQPPTTEDENIEQIIWRIGTAFSAWYGAKLAARLAELQTAVQEEEADGSGITVESLQHFFEFLKAHPTLRCPALSVTPERNIYASWKSGANRVFSVHFLPDGNVRFVIFCPNDKHSGETIRLTGAATVDVLMSVAEPHGVLSWASE